MATTPQDDTPAPAPPQPCVAAAGLRAAALHHVRAERRRVFPAVLRAGTLGGGSAHLTPAPEDRDVLDHALRADVVAALVAAAPGPDDGPTVVWLTRPGVLVTGDDDAAWLAAVRSAAAESGTTLPFAVVTRHGWHDPLTGEVGTWPRLRPHR